MTEHTYDSRAEFAAEMDRREARNFESRFFKSDGTIYMDGNSLGLMSVDSEAALLRAADNFKRLGIGGWMSADPPWFTYAETLGAKMAGLVGAQSGEVIVTGSTTLNIHSLLSTFYKPRGSRTKLLMDELNFPSDIYAAAGHMRLLGRPEADLVLLQSRDDSTLDEDDIIGAFDDSIALVLLPSVLYRSGQLLDIERLTKAAHARGILIGFDCCHSAGAVPHRLHEWGVDFAVWCCYKYLNGGPGASAAVYVHQRHHSTPAGLPGWFGNDKATQFDMRPNFEQAGGAGAWQAGTPHIFSMAPIEGSLNIFAEYGIDNVREKSLRLTSYLMRLADDLPAEHGFTVITPREPHRRGGHIALTHPTESIRVNSCLKKRGIVPDFRFPNIIRLAPIALYNNFREVWQTVNAVREIMETREYLSESNDRDTVS
ncbi:MAG: kynureninase [Defluviitaleaceae bacterium]|nr:kynureninase [Defluviitaleaceae bacterium]